MLNLLYSNTDEYIYIKKQPDVYIDILSIEKSYFGYPKYVKISITCDFNCVGYSNKNIIIKGVFFHESEYNNDKIKIYVKYDVITNCDVNMVNDKEKIEYIAYFLINNKKNFIFETKKCKKSLSI